MNRQNRKLQAQETLQIIDQGYYEVNGKQVNLTGLQADSLSGTRLYTPIECNEFLDKAKVPSAGKPAAVAVVRKSTLHAIREQWQAGKKDVGVLNFASAKNPGGGFLGGSLAQEESLAVAGNLYQTQLLHPQYYEANRACGTMCYTDHAIFSGNVVFFRDEQGHLASEPYTASVLTLPAVNYGQVLLKKEDPEKAKETMKRRMELSLALLHQHNQRHLILGAYGCGVFRNNPVEVGRWWDELLFEKGWLNLFETVTFAVLDKAEGPCIRAFHDEFKGRMAYESE